MKIKTFALLLLIGFGFLTSSNSDDDSKFESTAVISGFDLTLCACCGGWIGAASDKRFSELPQGSDIDLENAVFPISVQLNWSASNEYCGKGIVVKSIQQIKL